MTDERQERAAAALMPALEKYAHVHGETDTDTTLTVCHDDIPRIAARVLAAIDAIPGPATVTDDDVDVAYEGYWSVRPVNGLAPHPNDQMRAALEAVFAARTTARGEAGEPTEAEIDVAAEAIWGAHTLPGRFDPPLRWANMTDPGKERYRSYARAALIAARKAGQEGSE